MPASTTQRRTWISALVLILVVHAAGATLVAAAPGPLRPAGERSTIAPQIVDFERRFDFWGSVVARAILLD